jgi:hypothetical protein
MAADFAAEVALCWAEIVDLLTETRKLGWEVNGKAFLFPAVLLPKGFSFLTWLVCDWSALDDKLGQKVANHWGLKKELSEVKASLLKESKEHDTLQAVVRLVLGELGMTSEQGASLLVTRVLDVTDRACGLVKQALHLGV